MSLARSSWETSRAAPFSDPSSKTTLLCLSSSASSSARPQVQFLQAFFRRGALEMLVIGSHGRARSDSVSKASESMEGVPGALRVQSAFFAAESVFLRRGNMTGLDTDGACAGFWAMMVGEEGAESTVKPESVSSDAIGECDVVFWRCKVPSGVRAERSCESRNESLGMSAS